MTFIRLILVGVFPSKPIPKILMELPEQSSQWDGLRHWGMSSDSDSSAEQQRVWYGGTSKDEILDRSKDRIGIQHWAREGITGRGVLIDYVSWADKKGIEYSAFSEHTISLHDILEIARESSISFERGDILLVRSGATRDWETRMDVAAKKAYASSDSPKHAGVEASIDMLRWIWDTGIAVVAGDALSFEVYPQLGDIFLHDWFIAGWGMPIGKFELDVHVRYEEWANFIRSGEMFDLERLAEVCKELNRWSFFFTSMPLNMPGGVSSPSNAQAIF